METLIGICRGIARMDVSVDARKAAREVELRLRELLRHEEKAKRTGGNR